MNMSFSTMSSGWNEGFQTEAVIKWFNLTKGFGFVAPVDGSSDAFIHSSIVNRAGLRDVPEGTKMVVRVGDGTKGRQVLDIVKVLGAGEGSHGDARTVLTGEETEATGTVKWFKSDKGFGFVMPDDQSRDVFIHRSVVSRAGLQTLVSGQKVKMLVHAAAKGREAASIQLIE
jgi:CspA family cold shock protein